MSWNEEKVEKLKELWGKGSTASQIAEIIGGISRNAVIGKAHRLNLSSKIKTRNASSSQNFDNSLEEAAADLGAGPLTVFYTVTLPVISPALIAGWLLAFTLSFDDLVIASFVSGPGSSTLPIIVFSGVRLGVTPEVNAIATLIISIASLAVLVASLFMSRLILYRHRSPETDTDT